MGAVCLMMLLVAEASEDGNFFEKRVRPVLVGNCFNCHSGEAKKLKGNLFVDSRQGLLEGGDSGAAIVPGKPEVSRLIGAIEYDDIDLQMPPRKKLSELEIADLKEWIRRGAIWPGSESGSRKPVKKKFDLAARKSGFWAWQALAKPLVPSVQDQTWPSDDIDRFVLEKLEENGLRPMHDAERLTLLRRASFDLTGLPPTPKEMDTFLADDSEGAFATVVDRLLASEHFGERWARHWLDLVRYSETMGHEFDYPIQNAWRYRDYLIRAFNGDVPYSQIIREHVAGDLLARPRRNPELGINESVIGTAFYWFGQQKHSPVDIRQEMADTIDNQIDVLTRAFMGMTVSCARCHDHKFDAISTKDYYALFGILGSSRYAQRAIDEETVVKDQLEELQVLRRRMLSALSGDISPELKRAGEYISLALKLRREATANPPGSVVFEDFEGDGFDAWTSTGDAFIGGTRTQKSIGSYQGDVGAQGKFFVNSHNITRDGKEARSDRFTGTLTSPEFTITKDYIHFLVGGGPHKGKTCIDLLVDGQVVASETGRKQNRMQAARFEVRAHLGKRARIRAVDKARGSWGNIGLDHIVFSDDAGPLGEGEPLLPSGIVVAEFAQQNGLKAALLMRWVTALDTLKDLRVLGSGENSGDTVFADFATDDLKRWFPEGAAFQRGVGEVGGFFVNLKGRAELFFLQQGWVSSALLSDRLQGALRSPSFTVETDYVHLLVAGIGARVNAVVEGFTLIKNPIWGGSKTEIKQPEVHWVTLDLRMAKGRRAWLEFLDQSVSDPAGKVSYPADAWFAVRKIVFSNERKTSGIAREHPLAFKSGELNETRITSVARAVKEVAARLGRSGAHMDGAELSLLNWLSKDRLLMDERSGQGSWSQLIARHKKVRKTIPTLQRVPSMAEGLGYNEHVFIRGVHRNPGDEVPRRFLEAVQGSTNGFRTAMSGRLELADWLVDERNPLPARVLVNKVWHHLFGRGIVVSVDNFGVLGERPSHPELLDHLALWYREHGWSTKALIRRLMLTRSYRMASATTDATSEMKDPNNLLLHRANVKRLEGEALRDAILVISGSLTEERYGPPVPVHLTSFMEGRGRPKKSGPLDGDGKRSIYIGVNRNFMSPLMLAFDTPPPATTVGRRPISNVPAQALILMNDPFVVAQSHMWSGRLASRDLNDRELIDRMYRQVFGRSARQDEVAVAGSFLKGQASLHSGDREKAIADLAHVLFNVKEFIFVN